jgi:hypothetical protein
MFAADLYPGAVPAVLDGLLGVLDLEDAALGRERARRVVVAGASAAHDDVSGLTCGRSTSTERQPPRGVPGQQEQAIFATFVELGTENILPSPSTVCNVARRLQQEQSKDLFPF